MTDPATSERDRIAVNTIRLLAIDVVERARSGHPGAPMGLAEAAYCLWTRHLRHNPADPDWWNRDRFVLSCGHASALLYSLLYLNGYGLSLEELKNFRQLGSRTPGHPEYGLTPGVETTSGPLGQGLATAVGMAMAERQLAGYFNRSGHQMVNHRIWVLASDGDLMEGVTSEACSLAGHLKLGKLNVLYDANRITIDGATDLTFTEDVRKRY
ncbi:MAG: transketolase, partial [bacterium]|nr:transketolase [bacterium]